MPVDEWYYARGQERIGPVTQANLGAMAASGMLHPQNLVWREGMTDWAPASSVPGMFATPGAYPPGAYPPGAYPPDSAAWYSNAASSNYYNPRQDVEYAGFWLRFVAAFLDGIITSIGGCILGGMVGFVIGAAMSGGGSSMNDIRLAARMSGQVLGIVFSWLYAALMESSSAQATLGKMAMGIKVTDLQGERISFGRATGRHFGKWVSAIILGIGYLMAAFTERKQALHDTMAGCLVVRKG